MSNNVRSIIILTLVTMS